MSLNIQVYRHSSQSSNNTLVLLIHGLGAQETFTNKKSNWKDFILQDCELNNVDLGIVKYQTQKIVTGKSNKNTPIREIAQELKSELDLDVYNSYQNIILVGHSMGGLIGIYYLLQEIKREKETRIKSYISLASPFSGSSLANYHNLIRSINRNNQIFDLNPNGDFIDEINRLWVELQTHPLISQIDFTFTYGTQDSIVTKSSAIPTVISDKWEAEALNGDHSSILNILPDNLPRSYKIVRDRIKGVTATLNNETNNSKLICLDVDVIDNITKIEEFRDKWIKDEQEKIDTKHFHFHFPIIDIKLKNSGKESVYITKVEIKSTVLKYEIDTNLYYSFPVSTEYNILLDVENDSTQFASLSQVIEPNDFDRFALIIGFDHNQLLKYCAFNLEIILHYNGNEMINIGKHNLKIVPPVIITNITKLENVIPFPKTPNF